MPRMSIRQRRARLARRHHLAPLARTDDVVALAAGVVALHGTDPATVYLSAAARMVNPSTTDVEVALYEDRRLVRALGMRRTMFVMPLDLVGVVQAACTDALAPGERRRTLALLAGAGVPDAEGHLRALERATEAAIAERGPVTGADLGRSVPGLGAQIEVGKGTRWEGTVGITTRVLFLLATEQRIVRGRPDGGWTSSRYRWSPMSSWLARPGPAPTPAEARTELARCWLRAFGPATVDDLRWWTGLPLGQVRQALAGLDVSEVDLDGRLGMALADDMEPDPDPEPWVSLLPSLDPTTMGWKDRSWYLGDHAGVLFDGNGNAGPTVWCDGRVVGGWAQRADGEVVFELLEDVGADATGAIGAEAARLQAWLGPVRVRPRFPTPLQRRLTA